MPLMRPSNRRPLLAVGLASIALLAHEMLLIRYFSILLYPVAAYLVISVGLLGYGMGGTLLSLIRPRRVSLRLAGFALLGFAVTVIATLPWVWDAWRSRALAITLPAIAGLSFALGGLAIATILEIPSTSVNRVYFADLLGASLGAGLSLLGLNYVSGLQAGVLVAAVALFAASALFSSRVAAWLIGLMGVLLAAFGLTARIPNGLLPIVPKELALFAGLGSDVTWEYQGWGPLARVDVLSLARDSLFGEVWPVNYKLVTQDGGAPTLLVSPENDALNFIGERTNFGVPYWIRPTPARVLIVGLGGGVDLQTALFFGSQSVTAAEINGRMLELLQERYTTFTGKVAFDPRVVIVQADGRHVIQASGHAFDIIQLTGVDTTVASAGATPNLAENYLYTVEAFREDFRHLTPQGLLSVSFPDVEGLSLRLLSTGWYALRQERVVDPSMHIILMRVGGFAQILIKRSPFTREEVSALQDRLAGPVQDAYFPLYGRLFGTSFDPTNELLVAPGLRVNGKNATFAGELATGREQAWMATQNRNIAPATDDRPFFFVLDKWGRYAPNLEALSVALVLLAGASLAFLFVPMLMLGRRGHSVSGALPSSAYFILLGVAYIAVEVSLIQKLTLLLGHPSYALAITISTLLASSGAGSLLSGVWRAAAKSKVRVATLGTAIGLVLYAFGLSPLFNSLIEFSFPLRLVIAIVAVAVPGFLMGMPFPTGLAEVKRQALPFVPWAWALNSSASVMGTVGALLVAMNSGFRAVLLTAAAMYLLSGLAFAAVGRHASPHSRLVEPERPAGE